MSKAVATAYLATQVNTTSQGQLLLMLYDAAINFLKQARQKIDEKDYAAKGILISRATDILSELNQSLNKERGGKIAQNLNSLYLFCNNQLAQANLRMDTKYVDNVLNILDNLRRAYGQIVPDHDSQNAGAPATAQSATPAPSVPKAPTLPRPQLLKVVDNDNGSKNELNTARSRAASAYANSSL